MKEDAVEPLFAHVEPPEDTLGAPIDLPSVWTFRALRPGTAEFTALSYGERYCNDFWNWHYESAQSPAVVVVGVYRAWLPTIAGGED